jgi:hypothetical protein
MKWIKAPEALKALMEAAMQGKPAQKRTMFGYPTWFVNGYMVLGLFQDKVFARLGPEQRASLEKPYGKPANLEPMPGRPMKDCYVLAEPAVHSTKALDGIIDGTIAFAQTLPPKAAKKPGAEKKRQPQKGRSGPKRK